MEQELGLGTYLHAVPKQNKSLYLNEIHNCELVHYSNNSNIGRRIFTKVLGYADTQQDICSMYLDKYRLLAILQFIALPLKMNDTLYGDINIMIAKLRDIKYNCWILVSYDN